MKLALLLFSGFFTQSALAGSFSHRLQYFGQLSTLEECRSQLSGVSQRFAIAAGVEVLGADCVKSEYYSGGVDGEILYLAESRVAVTNTDARDIMGFDGYYSTVEQCEAAAQREESILLELTGLSAYVSYCYRASYIGPSVYRSRIEAVGTSEIKKFATFSSYFNAPLDADLLLEKSRVIASGLGLTLVESAVVRDNSGWHVAMDYYGTSKLYIHADEELKYESESVCLNAAQDAQQSWNAENLSINFFCAKSGRGFGLTHLWFSNQLFSEGDFFVKILPIGYATIEDCFSQKSAVIEKLTSAGSQIIGSACGLREGQPRLMIFENRRT